MSLRSFYKYQASGNDFIFIEDQDESFHPRCEYVEELCHRRFGIGADGLVVLRSSQNADISFQIFNPDGKEAACCGNALCCTVLHLNHSCTIETKKGIIQGIPSQNTCKISLPKSQVISLPIPLDISLSGYLVDTGVRHLVIFTKDIDSPHLVELAQKFQMDPRCGAGGANVTFATKEEEDRIRIWTYELGVNEVTGACGTGGGAAVLIHNTLFDPKPILQVTFPSKKISQFQVDNDGILWMEGEAVHVFTGNFLEKNDSNGYSSISSRSTSTGC